VGSLLENRSNRTYFFIGPKSSIIHAGSPKNIIWPYDKNNTLKMSAEILKNDKNNGHRFRFLALLKTYIFIFHFGSPPTVFELQQFFWCHFVPLMCAQLYKYFFSNFDLVFSKSWKMYEKMGFLWFFLPLQKIFYISLCRNKTRSKFGKKYLQSWKRFWGVKWHQKKFCKSKIEGGDPKWKRGKNRKKSSFYPQKCKYLKK